MALLPFGSAPGLTKSIADTLYQPIGGGGGSALAVQDFVRIPVDQTTTYEGIAAKGTARTASGWTVIKKLLTGNNWDTIEIYTASGILNNYASLTYTLSNSYPINFN